MALRAGYKGIKKYVADMLNKMNPGDSFATDAEIAATAQQIYADMSVVGAKNLLPFNLSAIKAANTNGTWSGNVYTFNDVSFTFNSDGSIKANGTASSTAFIGLPFSLEAGVYEVNGCPSGGSNSTYYTGKSNIGLDYGSGVTWNLSDYMTDQFYINVINGYTANNLMFYPMLRLASDTDPTYQPYAETNLQLTQNKADISALGTQESATASRLYHPGEHFYKDGKFCTVIGSGDVAPGTTWTLNTNYVEGTIASILKYLYQGVMEVSVTADGVKSYQTLLNELHTAFKNYVNAHTDEFYSTRCLIIANQQFVPIGANVTKLYNQISNPVGGLTFTHFEVSNYVYIDYCTLNATLSNNKYKKSVSNTITSNELDVPESQIVLKVISDVYKL